MFMWCITYHEKNMFTTFLEQKKKFWAVFLMLCVENVILPVTYINISALAFAQFVCTIYCY